MSDDNLLELHLSCPKSLEELLLTEAQALGLEQARQRPALVSGRGTLETAYRLCLWSRLANRVLLVLGRYPVRTADELYAAIQSIDWRDHLDSKSTLAIDFSGTSKAIDNSHFGALKVKDAIVDALRDRMGNRPTVEKRNPDLRVNVHLRRDEITVALDLSGTSLHQRGYRLQQGAAPLKENLAAAILLRANWPELAKQGYALSDPMCGMGTFLIEGALMAADVAPGLRREYWGFQGWQGHVPSIWNRLLDEAEQRAEKGLQQEPLWIRGYEADPRLMQPARNNIARAGLSDWVKVYQGELATYAPSPDHGQPGLMICNPPYGERLGDEASLLYLYQHLGERMRGQLQGWQAGVFTGAPQLCKRMGIRSQKQYAFFNGAIPCKLLMFDVQEQSFVTAREPEQGGTCQQSGNETARAEAPAMLSNGAQMFANRLQKNRKQLGKWLRQNEIQCYRLYDADMPEYAVAIDIYGDWVHVQEYAAPRSVDADKAQSRLLDVLAAIPSALGVSPDKVVVKRRERQSGLSQYERQASKGEFMEVREGNVKLLVNLTDYLDTGLFLDHRPLRLRIASEACGKRFLNLFCYTGVATVHAAAGGARTTTSVDLSKTYLDWARRNLSLNGFSEKNQLVQADVMQWLAKEQGEYDLIFIDPPTFSNSKRMQDVFDVQRDQRTLINEAMRLLAKDGTLYFSNNFRKFELEPELAERYAIEEISAQTIDQDFARNQKIHRAWRIRHLKTENND